MPISDQDYATQCDQLFAELETLLDERDDDIDYESNGGICEITLASGERLVVNRQPPMQEIWLAARSGGYHFRFADGSWLDTRDGVEFFKRLGDCLAG